MATSDYDELYDESFKTAAARRATGAVSGAATGASAGTSIMPGWGTLAGALIGAGVGAVGAGGATDAEKERARRIAELKRLRQLDALGLSEDERALMEQQLLGPVRAAERAQQEAILRAAATQDVGAGSFFKQAQSMDDATIQTLAEQKARIEAASLQRAAEQRSELQSLVDSQGEALTAERRALLGSILGAAETGIAIGGDIAGAETVSETGAKTMEAATGEAGDAEDYDAWTKFQSLYGEV